VAGLAATGLIELWIVVLSGSVALLSDAIHNMADGLTAVGRRPPTKRYPYGDGRAADLAGLVGFAGNEFPPTMPGSCTTSGRYPTRTVCSDYRQQGCGPILVTLPAWPSPPRIGFGAGREALERAAS
jgi:Cation efflux family